MRLQRLRPGVAGLPGARDGVHDSLVVVAAHPSTNRHMKPALDVLRCA